MAYVYLSTPFESEMFSEIYMKAKNKSRQELIDELILPAIKKVIDLGGKPVAKPEAIEFGHVVVYEVTSDVLDQLEDECLGVSSIELNVDFEDAVLAGHPGACDDAIGWRFVDFSKFVR